MRLPSPRMRVFVGTTFLAWTLVVLIAFYAVQKPIMPSVPGEPTELDELAVAYARAFAAPLDIAGPVNAFADVAVAFLITLAAIAAGDLILLRRPPQLVSSPISQLERWLMAGGTGFGGLGVVFYLCALTGLLRLPLLGLLLVAAPLLFGRHRLGTLWKDVLGLRHVSLPAPVMLLLVSVLGLAMASALAPPTAFDSWLYHLAVPRRALEVGRISPLLEMIPQEGWPQLMSALYMLAMGMRNDIAGQLLHFVFGLMTLLMIALAAQRDYARGERDVAPYALVLALSMPMVALIASWAYNDLALAFYHISSVYAYRRYVATGARPFLALAAAMAAFAVGMKYTAFILPLGIALHMCWTRRSASLRPVAGFALLTALLSGPWFLKNLVFYGNPFYPFLFGGAQWDSPRAAWYAQIGTGIGFDPIALLTLPIVAVQGYRDASFWDGRVGPLVLVCAPLLALRWLVYDREAAGRQYERLDPYLLVAGLGFVFWIAGIIASSALWQTRLLLPSLVLAIPAMADGIVTLRRLDLPSISVARVFRVLVALVIALGLFRQAIEFAKLNPLGYLLGSETADAYVERQWQEHVRALRALNELPPNVRVQFLWEPRTYLARRPVISDAILDALPHLTATSGGLAAGVRRWKSEGITHVLIFDVGAQVALRDHINNYSEEDAENLERLRTEYTRVVYRNTAYSLLEIK